MLPTTFTIPMHYAHYGQPADAHPAIVFNKMSDDATRVIYADAARSARTGTPRTITVAHTPAKPGPTGVDRSLVKYQTYELDETTGLIHIATVSLNFAIPRAAPFTSGQIQNMVSMIPFLLFPDYTANNYTASFVESIEKLSL